MKLSYLIVSVKIFNSTESYYYDFKKKNVRSSNIHSHTFGWTSYALIKLNWARKLKLVFASTSKLKIT